IRTIERLVAHSIDVDLAVSAHQRDDARHLTALNIACHALAQAIQPRLGQTSSFHSQFPPCSCSYDLTLPGFHASDHLRSEHENEKQEPGFPSQIFLGSVSMLSKSFLLRSRQRLLPSEPCDDWCKGFQILF